MIDTVKEYARRYPIAYASKQLFDGYTTESEYDLDTSIYSEWMLPLMIANPSMVDWVNVSISPREWMLPLISANPDLFDWFFMSIAPQQWMLPLMIANADRLDWDVLYNLDDATHSRIYEWMLPLILANPDKIEWYSINLNMAEWMIPIIEIDPNQIDWTNLDFEPWMVILLDVFPDHAYAMDLSDLQSPRATSVSPFSMDPTKHMTARKLI
jgi:hypothetical protein